MLLVVEKKRLRGKSTTSIHYLSDRDARCLCMILPPTTNFGPLDPVVVRRDSNSLLSDAAGDSSPELPTKSSELLAESSELLA